MGDEKAPKSPGGMPDSTAENQSFYKLKNCKRVCNLCMPVNLPNLLLPGMSPRLEAILTPDQRG